MTGAEKVALNVFRDSIVSPESTYGFRAQKRSSQTKVLTSIQKHLLGIQANSVFREIGRHAQHGSQVDDIQGSSDSLQVISWFRNSWSARREDDAFSVCYSYQFTRVRKEVLAITLCCIRRCFW